MIVMPGYVILKEIIVAPQSKNGIILPASQLPCYHEIVEYDDETCFKHLDSINFPQIGDRAIINHHAKITSFQDPEGQELIAVAAEDIVCTFPGETQ